MKQDGDKSNGRLHTTGVGEESRVWDKMSQAQSPVSPQRPKTGMTAASRASTRVFANSPRMDVLSSKKRGPAWSLGGRTEIKSSNLGPGPGAYAVVWPGKAPSYSMTSRKEDKNLHYSPGPGAYSPDGKLRKQIPISLKSRNDSKPSGHGQPGPGAYVPVNPNFVSPKWTMTGRQEIKSLNTTPGPQDYRPEKPRPARGSLMHGKIKYKDDESIKNPGPGAYDASNIDAVRSKPPAFSLQARASYNPMSARTPGPGAYTMPEARSKTAFSMTPRRDLKHGPAVTTPGPAAYTLPQYKARAVGMGVGDRFGYKDSKGAPGPGAYTPSIDTYSVKEGVPKYSMTPRRDELKSSAKVPGPGEYVPAMDTVKVRSPRFSIRRRLDDSGSGVSTPGPAHYHPQRPVTAPGISMKSRIDFKPSYVTPGPAAYEV